MIDSLENRWDDVTRTSLLAVYFYYYSEQSNMHTLYKFAFHPENTIYRQLVEDEY